MYRLLLAVLLTTSVTLHARNYWRGDFVLRDSVTCYTVDEHASAFEVEVCASMQKLGSYDAIATEQWGIRLLPLTGEPIEIAVGWGCDRYGGAGDSQFLYVSCGAEYRRFTDGVNVNRHENTLSVEVRDDKINVYIGRDMLRFAFTISVNSAFKEVELFSKHGSLDVSAFTLNEEIPEVDYVDRDVTYSTSGLTGVWEYLDRDTESRHARPGGEYTLAIYDAEGDERYEYYIVYLAGAKINSTRWRRGMVKGYLKKIALENAWSMIWVDSEFGRQEECNLIHDGDVITLNFPLLYSSTRFMRVAR